MNDNLLTVKATIAAFFTAVGTMLGWKGIMALAWVALLALDYITGTFAAMKAGEWCSKKAREGAWHKAGAMIVVIVAAIAGGIMLVICGNIPELGSILENAIKLGANPPAWLTKILAASLKAVENMGETATNTEKLTE